MQHIVTSKYSNHQFPYTDLPIDREKENASDYEHEKMNRLRNRHKRPLTEREPETYKSNYEMERRLVTIRKITKVLQFLTKIFGTYLILSMIKGSNTSGLLQPT